MKAIEKLTLIVKEVDNLKKRIAVLENDLHTLREDVKNIPRGGVYIFWGGVLHSKTFTVGGETPHILS